MKLHYLGLLAICLLALSCGKSSDYRINGVSDVNTRQDTTIILGLAVAQEEGKAEQVKLSVTGLPENVTAKFSSEAGTPDFSSLLTLTIGYKAPAGTHPIKVKGVSASGVTKEYPLNLKIDAVPDCKQNLPGTYIKDPSDCNGRFGTTDAILSLVSGTDNKIKIENFPDYGYTAYATVNCEGKKFWIDEITTSYYWVSGTGTFLTPGIVELEMEFKPRTSGPPPITCKSKMVKK